MGIYATTRPCWAATTTTTNRSNALDQLNTAQAKNITLHYISNEHWLLDESYYWTTVLHYNARTMCVQRELKHLDWLSDAAKACERLVGTQTCQAMKRCCCFLDTEGYVVGHRINASNTEVAGRGNMAGTLQEVECNMIEPRYIKLGCNKLFSAVKFLRESGLLQKCWAFTICILNFNYYQSGCESWLFRAMPTLKRPPFCDVLTIGLLVGLGIG